jgi:peptidoglycan/xylan/chitin deacetylase (PgdA/CDA1 family)
MAGRAARGAFKTVAAGLDALRRRPRALVVLAYHRVGGGSGLEIDLAVDVFARQVDELARRPVVSLDRGLEAVRNAAPSGKSDPVVVTWDDGPPDFADVALPILVRDRVPATLYVATRFIDESVALPRRRAAAVLGGTARRIDGAGDHRVAHRSHALLDRLPDDLVDTELDRSIGLPRDHLGVEALHFAYPKAIQGSPIQVSDGMRWFRCKRAGGMASEDNLRRLAKRWRYAGATSCPVSSRTWACPLRSSNSS